jgi:hypothetical protein
MSKFPFTISRSSTAALRRTCNASWWREVRGPRERNPKRGVKTRSWRRASFSKEKNGSARAFFLIFFDPATKCFRYEPNNPSQETPKATLKKKKSCRTRNTLGKGTFKLERENVSIIPFFKNWMTVTSPKLDNVAKNTRTLSCDSGRVPGFWSFLIPKMAVYPIFVTFDAYGDTPPHDLWVVIFAWRFPLPIETVAPKYCYLSSVYGWWCWSLKLW